MRQQRKPLFQRAGDEVNVPHVAVEVAHEPFEPLDRRTVGITEIVRDGRLKTLGQHVGRPVDVVMQVVACAQDKIVSGFELFPLAFADEFPNQILKIAQAAAAVFDVRLLHRRGIAELRPPRLLVRQARRNVSVRKTAHTPGQHDGFHALEQLCVTRDESRLDQRGLRLHVAVRDFDAIVRRPH